MTSSRQKSMYIQPQSLLSGAVLCFIQQYWIFKNVLNFLIYSYQYLGIFYESPIP